MRTAAARVQVQQLLWRTPLCDFSVIRMRCYAHLIGPNGERHKHAVSAGWLTERYNRYHRG